MLTYGIGCFYAYFYPIKYKEEIIVFAEENEIDGALIASLVNVESGYKEKAKSNKGAVGLMQLMPTTAEWLAGKMNLEYSEEKLLDAEYNLRIGSYYLAYLIKYFENEKLGICAYNAGQGNVQAWLKDVKLSPDGKTLKVIPYKETENYLNRVLKNYHYYKIRYK